RESDTDPARPRREQHHQHVAIGGLEAVDLLCVRIFSTECRQEVPVSNWEIGEWTQQRGYTFFEGLLGGGSYKNFDTGMIGTHALTKISTFGKNIQSSRFLQPV
ncbi:unnamed protein product, partial [Ectocarpus sp. 8 AP-2014]